MKIRHLKIERFRGIRFLDWNLPSEFACLIGPGDSGKTTILDALGLVLSPLWNVQFEDSDFFERCTDLPIQITATIGQLPSTLKSESKFGFLARGWKAGELHDEPRAGDELVISVRLLVDSSLEPKWSVVNDRLGEGTPIGAQDRRRLGCGKLGDFAERNFTWARGSGLARLTEANDGVSDVLTGAYRASRAAVGALADAQIEELLEAAKKAENAGIQVGASPRDGLRPHLDAQTALASAGALALHDGDIPVRRAGLGSRRLLAVGIQRELVAGGSLTLLDELEAGLEPHRLRRLIRSLANVYEISGEDAEALGHRQAGQVLATTHSPVTIGELLAGQLKVVRSEGGTVRVADVDTTLQPTLRKCPEAFLARKVLVCEGKTEVGMCRTFDDVWSTNGRSLAAAGVTITHGGGTEAPLLALNLARLGYAVCLFGDSDVELSPTGAELESAGVFLALWPGKCAVEQRIMEDLPVRKLQELVNVVMIRRGVEPIRDAVRSKLGEEAPQLCDDPAGWWLMGISDADLRRAISAAAMQKRNPWFKRVDYGEELAKSVIDCAAEITGTGTAETVSKLKMWTGVDGSP